jgi:hypothetical protein
VKAGLVVGERKVVTSVRSRSGQYAAARFEALIRKLAKRLSGSREARRLAVRNAVLSTAASRGRPERARAFTIPKPPNGQSRKADAGRDRRPY